MTYREAERKLLALGCRELRRRGGGAHRKWNNPATNHSTVVPDHGGKDRNHADNLLPLDFTIPVYIWGCGVAHGKDLYALNAGIRHDPGLEHPLHSDPEQPIRNGDGANLALKLFGLGPVPGSTINAKQDLVVGP